MKETILALLIAAIGLATVAVIVSKNAKTGDVLGAAAEAVGKILTAAEGPLG